ncbi:MAG: branched-chain amino acid ABC transporter permease [Nitrososphaerales archaeon]|nr:branched-chain amino acid ABC transporter permease [Nitrososphaerales archaeon]
MGLPQVLFFGTDLVSFGLSFLNFYALYFAISLSLNLEFGYTGIPNFGKVMFIAGGAAFAGSISGRLAAYVYGVGVHRDFIIFNTQIISDVNAKLTTDPAFAVGLTVLSLLVAAGVGALLGYLSSYPAIRLREDYLGMLLLGAAQFFQVILRTYEPLTGGAQNIAVPDPYVYWSSLGSGYRDLVAGLVASAFVIIIFLYAERVARAPLGRMLRAVRDNEDASRALGKDDAVVRRNILIISSAIAGMAGAIFTFYVASVEYDTWTRFAWTFWPFLIVIIGGAGNNIGVAVGTLFFTLAFKGLQQVQPYLQPYIFFDVNWLQDILFATLLIVILLLRPEGILRERSTPTLSRSKVSALVGALRGQDSGEEAEPESSSRLGRRGRRLWKLARRRQKSEAEGPP